MFDDFSPSFPLAVVLYVFVSMVSLMLSDTSRVPRAQQYVSYWLSSWAVAYGVSDCVAARLAEGVFPVTAFLDVLFNG